MIGPCVSGPALLLGMADVVVMTSDAFAYVSGPDTVRAFTGVDVDHRGLGGAAMHERRSGVASMVVADEDAALDAIATVLDYLPSNHLEDPPVVATDDPVDRDVRPRRDRRCRRGPTRSYDVRAVVEDVLDARLVPRAAGQPRAEPRDRPRRASTARPSA